MKQWNTLCETSNNTADLEIETNIIVLNATGHPIRVEETLDLTKVNKDLEYKHRELTRRVKDI